VARGNEQKKNQKKNERIVIVNPKIVWKSKEKSHDWEGCLSLEGVRGLVPRHRKIRVRYTDEKGGRRERAVSGFLARVFQHEIDHLNGALYVDRMNDMKTLMTVGEFRKQAPRS
jgi:peptide deformylase